MPRIHQSDHNALAKVGADVRNRLEATQGASRFPLKDAEIYLIDGFLSADLCSQLVKLIEDSASPSRLMEEENWEGYRTSSSSDINPHDAVIKDMESSLVQLTGLEPKFGESPQGQRYRVGEYYHEHCDWFDTSAPYWEQEKKNGGQRSWTAMIYLNHVEEGGYTDFTRLGLRIEPRLGGLVLWNNARVNGRPNPWTMHAARPVVRGVKYVITKWYRAGKWLQGSD